MLEEFAKKYHQWRRRTLPPPISDIEWRHKTVVDRLDHIEQTITNRFLQTTSTPAQQREIVDVLRLLEPKAVAEFKKIRVGSAGDGGYVQIDDLAGVSHALSFGISDNDDWDLVMAKAGVPVEQFDHSVEKAPSSHPLLHFHRKMIAVEASAQSATLPNLVAEHSRSSEADVILKIDIEGCEWDVFDDASADVLSKLCQIVCEFHDLSHLTDPLFRTRARRVLAKLTEHFAPIHVHGNNSARLCNIANIPVPDVLEITFVSRRRYRFVESSEIFPTSLDAPNAPHVPDIRLGSFRF